MKKILNFLLCAVMLAAASCSEDPTTPGGDKPGNGGDNPQQPPQPSRDDTEVNMFIDSYMASHYLWNEEYDMLDKDFKSYYYDEFLFSSLQDLYLDGVNRKDGYIAPDDYGVMKWHFYTEAQQFEAGTLNLSNVKTQVRGFGLKVQAAEIDPTIGRVVLIVRYVYPDSPAAKAGIKRGTLIGRVDGQILTRGNYRNYMQDFINPHKTNVMHALGLVEANSENGAYVDIEGTTGLNTGSYYETPVIFSGGWRVRDRVIGYMVLADLNEGFEDDIENAFSVLYTKDLTDMVVDLRYCTGGSMKTSIKLASILAGTRVTGSNMPFAYLRYNDKRMKDGGYDLDNIQSYPCETFDQQTASSFGFNFPAIHFIVSGNTAAAGEMVIHALKGIDVPVRIVGNDYTNGKNLGIEPKATDKPIDGYDYLVSPVTFKIYNAKGEENYSNEFLTEVGNTDKAKGFLPDVVKQDFDYIYPIYDWGALYCITTTDEDTGEKHNTEDMVDSDFIVSAIEDIIGDTLHLSDLNTSGSNNGEQEGENEEVKAVQTVKTLRMKALPQPVSSDFRKNSIYTAVER